MLDLKAGKERNIVFVALDPGSKVGHDVEHELLRLVINIVGIDKNLTNVRLEVIANGANHQAGLLINKISARLQGACIVNGLP